MSKLDPDVVHLHHLSFKWPFAALETNRLWDGDTPLLVSEHGFHNMVFGPPSQRRNMRELYEQNISEVENIILNTQQTKSESEAFFGDAFDPQRCWTGINGLNIDKYQRLPQCVLRERLGVSSERPLLLFVSRFIERKGIYTLLNALLRCYNRGLEFNVLFVGDGPASSDIEAFRSAWNHSGEIYIEKDVDDLVPYYNASDLFVVPSWHEDCGLVYLEAMACGTPVIGSEMVPETTIPSTEYGYRPPVADATALADAIERAVKAEWDADTLRAHAESFAWDGKISEYELIYDELTK
jgi:glycosyltransferase involved in cell wall biosynthesis